MADNFFKISKGQSLEPRATDPSNPQSGDIFFASASHGTKDEGLYQYVNGAWVKIAQGIASGIEVTPSGNLTSTDVQSALEELQGEIDDADTALANHLSDASDAHDASAISSIPSGNLAATDVQGALNELQSDVDTRATSSALSAHTGASTDVHGLSGGAAVVGTTSSQTLTNKTITGASIQTPTRLDVKQDTLANLTTYASSATEGQVVYATDTKLYYGIKNNALVSLGGGSGGLDIFYTEAFTSTQASGLSSGNNASFLGGGTLAGTLANETSSPISGERSIKFTQAAGSLNDYFAMPAISLEAKQKGQWVGITFYYKYDGNNNDITFRVRDNTGAVLISSALDVLPAAGAATRFSTSVFVPSTSSVIQLGFQVTTLNNTKILIVDDFEATLNPFVYKDLVTVASVSGVGNGGNSITAGTTNLTFTEVLDTHGAWNGTQYTVLNPTSVISVKLSVLFTGAAVREVYLYKNGSQYKFISPEAPSQTTQTGAYVSYKGEFVKGDVLSFRTTTNGGTLINNSILHYIAINEMWDSEHVVSPARTNLTDFATYTPSTTQGFGTTTNNSFKWKLVGDMLVIMGSATTGTVSGSEARIGLPTNPKTGSAFAVSSVVTSNNTAGTWSRAVSTNESNQVLINGGETYLKFTTNGSGQLTAQTGTTLIGSTSNFAFFAMVPVTNASSEATFLAAIPAPKIALIKDVKTSATDGGGFTSGSYVVRTLTTVSGDSEIVSLASNAFTLSPGKYEIMWDAPAFAVDQHKSRLVTDPNGSPVLVELGSVESSASTDGVTSKSSGFAVVTITSSTTYGIQHRCTTTKTGNGLGRSAGFGDSEIYTQVKITKLR